MRIEFERFLTITALLAGATATAFGCTVQQNDNDNEGGAAGVGGRAGSGGKGGTVGSSGQAGTGGGAGTGGTAGQSGSGGQSGSAGDASTCLGDTLPAGWDAGAAPCEILPYKTACDGGATPLAYDVCTYMDDGTSHTRAKKGVAGEVARCFAKITGDACNDSWVQDEATKCLAEVFPKACGEVGAIPVGDAQSVTCKDMVDLCTSYDAGPSTLTEADCKLTLNAFQPWAQAEIVNCWLDLPDMGDCKDDFDYCVFPP